MSGRTELNLETLKEKRNKLSEKFAEKCVKTESNKYMFDVNKNTQMMKLRHRDKYKVKNVKTVRMQKSAIINMTKHLNKKHKESKSLLNY